VRTDNANRDEPLVLTILRALNRARTILALIVLCVAFAIIQPSFYDPNNIVNIVKQIAITAIVAAGMTFVILTAGIDLSVGSLIGLTGMVATYTLDRLGMPAPVAVAAGIGSGALCGLINGASIIRFNVPPFVSTLAMMTMARGAAFLIVEDWPIAPLPDSFKVLGVGRLGPETWPLWTRIPVPVIVMAAVFVVAGITLKKTPFGRYVYAVGGNEEASRLSGINVNGVKLAVYVICGLLSGLAGVIMAAKSGCGHPNAGLMYELEVIAAVVVGGTSLFGGKGTIPGTLVGALLIGTLTNGLNICGVGAYQQSVVKGAVILLAVIVESGRQRRK
jgi:ribose/xylose/arabinose/galactoside ABC-type transport system permease subunit